MAVPLHKKISIMATSNTTSASAVASKYYRDNNGFLTTQTPESICFKSGFEASVVDTQKEVITGISICTEGYAKGHYHWIDRKFIDDLVKLGNLSKGVRCRIGHPNWDDDKMTAFVGEIINFRAELRDGTYRAIGDLVISPSAALSPSGNLKDWVLSIAEHDSIYFGMSIVFIVGYWYYKTKSGSIVADYSDLEDIEVDDNGQPKYYITIKQLLAADIVDEPAANDNGFYSAQEKDSTNPISKYIMEEQKSQKLSENIEQLSAQLEQAKQSLAEKDTTIAALRSEVDDLKKQPAAEHYSAAGADTTPKPTTIDYYQQPWNKEAAQMFKN